MKRTSLLSAAVLLIFLGCASAPAFQSREHLTAEEIELVKDAQILDKRIDVFIKAADRRMLALAGTAANSTRELKKDSETWGELPTGTRAELIGDIAKIFDEAITNIDDVNGRDESNPLIPKALRKLSAAAARIVAQLKPAEAQARGDAELGSFDQLVDYAETLAQAANKLPPPVEKKVKGKSEKQKATN